MPPEASAATVLFPTLRTIPSPKQVADLGDRMEEDEKKVLGDEGFKKAVDQVAATFLGCSNAGCSARSGF